MTKIILFLKQIVRFNKTELAFSRRSGAGSTTSAIATEL